MNSLRLATILSLVAVFPVTGSAQELPPAESAPVVQRGAVSGFVFDYLNGAPLSGIIVKVGDVEAVTNADGYFEIEVPVGTYKVFARDAQQEFTRAGDIKVLEGGVTEVLLTYSPNIAPLPMLVEEPTKAKSEGAIDLDATPGTVTGVVVSDDDGSPIGGARIYVRGIDRDATTDAEGRFTLELPAGEWDLSVLAPSYATQRMDAVEILAEQTSTLSVSLVPSGFAMEDFMVRAPKVAGSTADLMSERRDSTAVADVMGQEQMARNGDSTAAGALARVTGLTLVDGKYIFVRGLGDRYSATTLDGGPIPSPEPERRIVPLDLFPASVLDSVVVQKTFSPNLPAEFGGGLVQLRTRSFPKTPVYQISVGTGVTPGQTFQTGQSYQGGPTDFLGIDGGTRALPENVAAASQTELIKEGDRFSDRGYTASELEAFGESMPNVWSAKDQYLGPDVSISGNAGTGFKIGGRDVGVLAAVNYNHRWDLDEYRYTDWGLGGGGDNLIKRTDFNFRDTTRRVRLGGMLAMGAEPGEGQKVESTTLVLRFTDDETRTYSGFDIEGNNDIKVTRLRWVERMLLSEQLRGEHELGDKGTKMDWRAGYALATRIEPDRRQTRYDEEQPGLFLLDDGPDGNQRFFSTSEDRTWSGAVNFEVPLDLGMPEFKVKTGASYMRKDREVTARRYKFMHRGPISRDQDVLGQDRPEDIFTAQNIGSDGFQFNEITQRTDNYLAAQNLLGVYGMVEAKPTEWLALMAGARMEWNEQVVTTFELFNPNGEEVNAGLNDVDILPAVTGTVVLPKNHQVRLGYGRTVNRPEFRELSPAIFKDVVGGRQTFGNPNLVRATIDNVDLRWEWFPQDADVVSVSAFYKWFSNPIERVVVIGADPSTTFQNADGAYNVGIEAEVRKGLGFMSEALRDMYFATNATLIQSKVQLGEEAGGINTNPERALQGQSPWMVNAQLGYDNPDLGLNTAILFNAVGPRIVEVGSLGLPDSYEGTYNSLDVVLNTRLYKGLGLQFRATNLVDSVRRVTIGENTVTENRDGRRFTLKVRYNW